jgi:hypothetical protein
VIDHDSRINALLWPVNLVDCFTFAELALSTLPSLSSASEHYVGAWAPRVGGQALTKGEIPLISVFQGPAHLGRFDVRSVTCLTFSRELADV